MWTYITSVCVFMLVIIIFHEVISTKLWWTRTNIWSISPNNEVTYSHLPQVATKPRKPNILHKQKSLHPAKYFRKLHALSFKSTYNYCPSGILHIAYVFLPILHSIPLNLQLKILLKDFPTAHFISSSTTFFSEWAMSPTAHAKDMCGRGSCKE